MNLEIPELDFNSSTTQAPYQNIRDDIINGKLLPDEKLKIRDLRLRYNAGSSPLREALSAQGIGTATFVLLWILMVHQLEANVLNPKIMGDHT